MTDEAVIVPLKAPVGRKAIAELVVQRILDLVKGGQLVAGERLPPERELAVQLDVSRPTVREALRALSVLGVLEIRHGGGVYVTALDDDDLLSPLDFYVSLNADNLAELFDARMSFDSMIAGLAVERLSDAEIERLQQLVDAQRDNPEDAELFHDTDAEFHKMIFEASGNILLTRVGKLLMALGETGRRAFLVNTDTRLRSIADHEVIVAALRARDTAAAQQAVRQHMINVRKAWREVKGV